ncbi:unnamed protein product [Gongylonema pulchrum]|uniref:Uncharacterized protein n=1 Tax=Gongylonema pulchrum TaxID=637853 RepID=A0A183DE90_9BILA|nr:unnamed protein product [Gongylonema pulchrum]
MMARHACSSLTFHSEYIANANRQALQPHRQVPPKEPPVDYDISPSRIPPVRSPTSDHSVTSAASPSQTSSVSTTSSSIHESRIFASSARQNQIFDVDHTPASSSTSSVQHVDHNGTSARSFFQIQYYQAKG